MSIHSVSAELTISTSQDDLHRLAGRNRLAAVSRGAGRVAVLSRIRALARRLHDASCLPAFGGCDEELIDARTAQLTPIAE